MPQPENLPQRPRNDEELHGDAQLRPTLSIHAQIVDVRRTVRPVAPTARFTFQRPAAAESTEVQPAPFKSPARNRSEGLF